MEWLCDVTDCLCYIRVNTLFCILTEIFKLKYNPYWINGMFPWYYATWMFLFSYVCYLWQNPIAEFFVKIYVY